MLFKKIKISRFKKKLAVFWRVYCRYKVSEEANIFIFAGSNQPKSSTAACMN